MKGFLLISCLLLFASCASYRPKLTKDIKTDLNKSKIVDIRNKYELLSYRAYSGKTSSNRSYPKDIFENLNDTITKKDTSNSVVEVSFEDKNTLSIKLCLKNIVSKQIYFKGEVRKDGFFHLSNKIRNCHGIPYLLGGCYIEKTRLGIAKMAI